MFHIKLTDFHTHTFLSDGVLPPAEQIRRFTVNGFYAIAITDHVDSSNIDFILNSLISLQEDFQDEIIYIPCVEITHVPPYRIPILAKKAKDRNCLVVVHGKTIVEPVAEGTNLAAVITTTPRVQGRSFGTNVLEAAVTAYSGLNKQLTEEEMKKCVDELGLKAQVHRF